MLRDRIRRRTRRTIARTIYMSLAVTALAALSTVLVPSPANAGVFDGDVANVAPASVVVKIAKFGTGQAPFCNTWNGGSLSCKHYWLPSNRTDDQINGANFDTDGFMVEREYLVVYPTFSRRVPAFVWTKIANGSNVRCSGNNSNSATCTVAPAI